MIRTIVLGAVGAAVVGGTGVAAVATSGSSSPTPRPATAGQHHPFARAVLKRMVHGSVVVRGKDGAFVTVDFGRGTVAAVSPSALAVHTADGKTLTFALTSATKYRVRSGGSGHPGSLSDIKKGEQVVVLGPQASAGAEPVAKRVIELG